VKTMYLKILFSYVVINLELILKNFTVRTNVQQCYTNDTAGNIRVQDALDERFFSFSAFAQRLRHTGQNLVQKKFRTTPMEDGYVD
jgi:hypothetical protein